MVPKKRHLVLHSFPDVEDQLVAILRWMAAHPEDTMPTSFLISGSEVEVRRRLRLVVGPSIDNVEILRKIRPLAIWRYWRSDTVMFTHGLYGFMPVPENQCVINLWHGMPAKTIWKAASAASRVIPCTWLLSTSEKFSDILAKASGLPRECIRAIGLPRNDTLLAPGWNASSFREKILGGFRKLIIYLPTYRTSRTGYITDDGEEMGSTLMMSEEEIVELDETLKELSAMMLVKPHPMSIHYGQDVAVTDRIQIVSDKFLNNLGVTLYDALAVSDLLITDVSSVYIDYLVTRNPCLIYFPDIEAYRKTRRFLLEPIEKWVPSKIHISVESLILSIKEKIENDHCTKLSRLHPLLNSQLYPEACDLARALKVQS